MMKIETELKKRLRLLQKHLSTIQNDSCNELDGRIIAKNVSDTCVQFYKTSPGSKIKYLSIKEQRTISGLLQKRYNTAVKRICEKQISAIENFLKVYDEKSISDLFFSFNKNCRNMVHFYEYPNEVYAEMWKKKKYVSNPFPKEISGYKTLNNEQVRSKSEVIIANCLREAGVPYKYECPLDITGFKTFYPDFTVLNKRTREIFYWEHCGKMDSEEYRMKYFEKLKKYASTGIVPGNGLILTFEDNQNHLDISTVDSYIENLLK